MAGVYRILFFFPAPMMVQKREILFSAGEIKEGFSEKVVSEPSRWEGLGKVERGGERSGKEPGVKA